MIAISREQKEEPLDAQKFDWQEKLDKFVDAVKPDVGTLMVYERAEPLFGLDIATTFRPDCSIFTFDISSWISFSDFCGHFNLPQDCQLTYDR